LGSLGRQRRRTKHVSEKSKVTYGARKTLTKKPIIKTESAGMGKVLHTRNDDEGKRKQKGDGREGKRVLNMD